MGKLENLKSVSDQFAIILTQYIYLEPWNLTQ